MKNVFAALVTALVVAVLFACASCASAQNVYELDATVTETCTAENGASVIVVDVVHPNGAVHEWAFYGDASVYPVGSDAVVTIDLYHDIIQDARPA